MDVKQLQTAIGTAPDGAFGPKSKAALLAHFTNTAAPAVTPSEIAAFAARLGATVQQVRAVAAVESGGAGFDNTGKPKILYERHIFNRLTKGKWSPASFSQPKGGGYSEDSWAKLAAACAVNPDAAFASCSWGRFQVMGMHSAALGYASPYALAHSTVSSEAAHYELLCRYIEVNGLVDEVRALSTDPETCRAFARGYNGPGYEDFAYHVKLARAMR